MRKLSFVLLWLCVVTPYADAQAFPNFDAAFAKTPAGLWRRADVQRDVDLQEPQVTRLRGAVLPIQEQYDHALTKIRGLERFVAAEQFARLRQQSEEAVMKVLAEALEPQQLKRLGQIALQVAGGDTFLRPEIQKELGLSEEQKKKMQAVAKDFAKTTNLLERDARGAVTQEETLALTGQNIVQARNEYAMRMRVLLTPAQMKLWRQLSGDYFPRPRKTK
jgi:hypothetical protein